MNRLLVFFFTVFFMLNVASDTRGEETIAQFGRFGKIALYHPSAHPVHAVLFVSGDGGWNLGVVDMARELAALDALVVGVDITYYLKQLERSSGPCAYPAADFELLSKYFWTQRTPEQTAKDLERIIRHYVALWKKEKVVLIGYSLGADIVPFSANRLSEEVKSRVDLIALLGPGLQVDFEFHLGDWLGSSSKTAFPTMPEVMQLGNDRILCIYGEKEKDSLCPKLQENNVKKVVLPGAHHFGGNYAQIAETILSEVK